MGAISRWPSTQLKAVRSDYCHDRDQPESLECLVKLFWAYQHCPTSHPPASLGVAIPCVCAFLLLMLTPLLCNYPNPLALYRAFPSSQVQHKRSGSSLSGNTIQHISHCCSRDKNAFILYIEPSTVPPPPEHRATHTTHKDSPVSSIAFLTFKTFSAQTNTNSHFNTMSGNGAGIVSTPDAWYCPSCGYGPHNPLLDVGCANCGYIPRRRHRQQAHSFISLMPSTFPIAHETLPGATLISPPTTEASELCHSNTLYHSLPTIAYTPNDFAQHTTSR
ncbi:unnamed protein product [Tuber aestivum]|uniref:Uncharacterized protein n=1 Tax=Tuber aestivum TaxID=59557 RepID=A0A292Q9B3_9PEZI|nr:unnamed protein product [Tuber aestivum]